VRSGFLTSIVFFGLCACDVAPGPVLLEQSSIEAGEEGYQFFIDTTIAEVIAESVSENCRELIFDTGLRDEYRSFFHSELERLSAADPRVFDEIMGRLGFPIRARDVADLDVEELQNFSVDRDFFITNPELTADVGTRAIGIVFRTGLEYTCEDGEREIAQQTRAGSFLFREAVPIALE